MPTNITYLESTPSVVHSIGKFVPSEEGEIMYEDPRDLQEGLTTDPRHYFITWDQGVPTTHKKTAQEIQDIADADAAEEAAYLAELAADEARWADHQADRVSSAINKKTPQEIRDYIDGRFAAATTNEETLDVIRDLLKKVTVYAAGIMD